jgi:hypothetical protein
VTWTRYDDGWTKREWFLDMPYDVRWHYVCMIEHCSAHRRYDGILRRHEALRCSDLDDPESAVRDLVTVGLVEENDGRYKLIYIDEHIPPPHLRDDARKKRQKEDTQRHRAHKAGDHSQCLPGKCPKAPQAGVSSDVSAYTGTGQDGTATGREGGESRFSGSDIANLDVVSPSRPGGISDDEWDREWGEAS